MSMKTDCTDIWIRKSEFVAKTQFPWTFMFFLVFVNRPLCSCIVHYVRALSIMFVHCLSCSCIVHLVQLILENKRNIFLCLDVSN